MKIQRHFGRTVSVHFDELAIGWGTRRHPRVNWSAYGPVSISEATQFMKRLARAIDYAKAIGLVDKGAK